MRIPIDPRSGNPWVTMTPSASLKHSINLSTATAKRKRNISGNSSSQATQGRRGNKSRRVDNEEGNNRTDRATPFDNDDDDNEEINALTPQEANRIKSEVLGALRVCVPMVTSVVDNQGNQKHKAPCQKKSSLWSGWLRYWCSFFFFFFFFANQWNTWYMYTRLLEPNQIFHTQSMVAKRGRTNRANRHTPMWKSQLKHGTAEFQSIQ